MSRPRTSRHPMRDPSRDGSVGQLGRTPGAAAPLVKPTLRGILPHGSEVPRGPIPLRSAELDDSPCCQTSDVDSSKTNPLFHRRTPCVTLQPRPMTGSATASVAPHRWTPRVRSIAQRRANSAASAIVTPLPATSKYLHPGTPDLTEWRTPCTSVRVAPNVSSACVDAPTVTFFSAISVSGACASTVMSPCW
jgi:hypothetical protein